ncbi:16S rRNA (cytosine(967)-C(5))-methyltransferase RsmB [Desulforhopalus sp. 52FAK]
MQKQNNKSARYCAAKILCSLFKSQKPVKPIFDRVVQENNLPSNDRNLTMQLVYGVLRQRQFLDKILAMLSRTPIRKLDPFVHQALAVGLFQIFFLSRIPESAAVNEAVNSCKAGKIHKRLHGFVNGVLRQAIRTKDELKQKAGKHKGKKIPNHPEWMVARWQKHFGNDATTQLCESNNSPPVLSLRINTTQVDPASFLALLADDNIEAEAGRYSSEAIILPNFSGSIAALPGYDKGFFQVQDEAAQLATTLLSPFIHGGQYLDGCAGLGGKTSHIIQKIIPLTGQVHAVDPESFRLEKLAENMQRLFETPPLVVHETSLLDLSPKTLPSFDGILIDAPCSGTGVIGRHPDIRWNRQLDDLQYYQAEQIALLSHGATLLKTGGVLVYATCSLEPEENAEVVHAFLLDNPEYELTDCRDFLPESAHHFVRDGFFHPLPSGSIDGFFAARLMKCG